MPQTRLVFGEASDRKGTILCSRCDNLLEPNYVFLKEEVENSMYNMPPFVSGSDVPVPPMAMPGLPLMLIAARVSGFVLGTEAVAVNVAHKNPCTGKAFAPGQGVGLSRYIR